MTHARRSSESAWQWRRHAVWVLAIGLLCTTGCFAPLHSYGIAANRLSDDYRFPYRTMGPPLNYANLTQRPPPDYLLGPNDVLAVTVPDLYLQAVITPINARIMANGEVYLPLVGAVRVEGMNLLQAQRAIDQAYANGFLQNPRVSVSLFEKQTVSVLVLGQVMLPGVHALPKYENDVGHALAASQGFAEDAGTYIEVHRRIPSEAATPSGLWPPGTNPECEPSTVLLQPPTSESDLPKAIVTIPLRGPGAEMVDPKDIVLQHGDVVVVPSRRHEVFYVVGRLNQTNTVRFTVGNRERELGIGFVLPRDREIDVVTAVAMAGYIDPIDSPTTVTVHRVGPNGCPLLIHVDLIKARYDARETVLVQAGDIIYLNPDGAWWFRRTFDRVVDSLILIPYAKAVGR